MPAKYYIFYKKVNHWMPTVAKPMQIQVHYKLFKYLCEFRCKTNFFQDYNCNYVGANDHQVWVNTNSLPSVIYLYIYTACQCTLINANTSPFWCHSRVNRYFTNQLTDNQKCVYKPRYDMLIEIISLWFPKAGKILDTCINNEPPQGSTPNQSIFPAGHASHASINICTYNPGDPVSLSFATGILTS